MEEQSVDTRRGRPTPAPLSHRGVRLLWLMLAVGIAARLVVAFRTYGVAYDMHSFQAVRDGLREHAFHVYSLANSGPHLRWPYLPGFFPWIASAGWLADHVGGPFHGWINLPQIAADAALAWLVQYYLALRGASERMRLAATALVILGPSFAVVSGYHAQIDQLAILPAAGALVVWERMAPGMRRALVIGLLVGLGIAIKTVPVLMLVVFLPRVSSKREGFTMLVTAVAVPLLALLPFLIADHDATVHALREHRALPGTGGISLVVQPGLARIWLLGQGVRLTSLSQFLFDHQPVIVGALLAPFALLLALRRPPPAVAATILWIAMELLGIGFAMQYVVWALPFALMAGYLWQVAGVQAALLLPTILVYHHGLLGAPQYVYVPIMIAVWAVLMVVMMRMAIRVARRPLISSAASE